MESLWVRIILCVFVLFCNFRLPRIQIRYKWNQAWHLTEVYGAVDESLNRKMIYERE